MRSTMLRVITLTVVVALTACSGGGAGAPVASLQTGVQQQYAQLAREMPDALPGPQSGFIPFLSPNPVRARCPRANEAHRARCFSYVRTDIRPVPNSGGGIPSGAGYTPQQLQAAYGLTSAAATKGKGQTVAIVDYASYPTAASDLATFRKAAGLPACTLRSHCLRIVNQDGNTSRFPPFDDGWAGEQSLDLDMVSAICPNCHILLVQANTAYDYDLEAAEMTAANMGAQVISNSFGIPEALQSDPAYAAKGHVYVASAGDDGAYNQGLVPPANSPCTYATVVCAGGTQLVRAHNARGWTERVWNDLNKTCSGGGNCGATGSGCSTAVPKPAWQKQAFCSKRVAADASAVAAVSTPVASYYSPDGGWEGVGGTSVSSPILAAVFALAGNATTVPEPHGIWRTAKTHFHDVVKGTNFNTNNPCPQGYNTFVCTARAGYDGPTGWGTPNGIGGF